MAIFFLFKIHCTSSRRVLLQEKAVELEEPSIVPSLDLPMRWNSTHDMLQSCLRVKKSITYISEEFSKDTKDENKIKKFTNSDWNKIQLITDFLEPFKQATKDLSGSDYLPASQWYFIFQNLTAHIKSNLAKNEISFLHEGITLLKNKLEEYFPYFKKVSMICMILDPRLKLCLLDDKIKIEAKTVLNYL